MAGRADRRHGGRQRVVLTALLRRSRRRVPVILGVVNLGPGGARCRTRVPLRRGARFPAEFLLDGTAGQPKVIRVHCRVVWTKSRVGPTSPVQEIGVAFLDLQASDRALIASRLRSEVAA